MRHLILLHNGAVAMLSMGFGFLLQLEGTQWVICYTMVCFLVVCPLCLDWLLCWADIKGLTSAGDGFNTCVEAGVVVDDNVDDVGAG